ncbi:hypothetical protein GHT06_016481 [Daphnia sinensis]|uniref:Apple domain-containing protein n=1 Tax=Daphnia sinensis TaxID=1820382 RepID=A0AAD5L5Z3_9CRUS|nr:hypothetical protein GHT06_016481 [Daphnia sinensis]
MPNIVLAFLFLFTFMSVKTEQLDAVSENPRSDILDNVFTLPEKLTSWNTTSSGIKWLHHCDLPGYDVEYRFMPIENSHIDLCSQACIDTSGCKAFRWNDGWCFLKNIPPTLLSPTQANRGTCGFLPWEFFK